MPRYVLSAAGGSLFQRFLSSVGVRFITLFVPACHGSPVHAIENTIVFPDVDVHFLGTTSGNQREA